MTIRSCVAVAAMALAASGACAKTKTYNIQLSDFCDAYTLTVTDKLVVGASVALGCDDSYVVGTTAKLNASVLPGGNVLAVGGDLGLAPSAFLIYFNLSTLEETLYGTTDGSSEFVSSTPFTLTGEPSRTRRNLPPQAHTAK